MIGEELKKKEEEEEEEEEKEEGELRCRGILRRMLCHQYPLHKTTHVMVIGSLNMPLWDEQSHVTHHDRQTAEHLHSLC